MWTWCNYSALMPVAYGSNVKEASLDGQVIRAKQLEGVASQQAGTGHESFAPCCSETRVAGLFVLPS